MSIGWFFDADGTLFPSEELWRSAEQATVRDVDAQWTDQLGQSLIGQTVRRTAELIAAAVPGGGSVDAVERILFDHYQSLLWKVEPLPGAADALRAVHDLGLPLAVVSNSPHGVVAEMLRQCGLADYVQYLIGRPDPGQPEGPHAGKPAPDMYLLAMNILGVESPFAIAIEDTYTGLTAAWAAGMWTVGVGPRLVGEMPVNWRLETLRDLDVGMISAHVAAQAGRRPGPERG